MLNGHANGHVDGAAHDLVDLVRSSPLFDADWYLERYTDVARAKIDPVAHYLDSGAAELRDPGPAFSTEYYLRSNPDVHRAGVNPLVHYLQHGAGEGRASCNTHDRWVREFGTLDETNRAAIRLHIAGLSRHPTISILVPVYDTPARYLAAMIASVTNQVYPYWELCLADDCSTVPHVREVLRDAAARDARIKIALRTENGHICAATNTALGLASGEFVCLLDHDDLLHENALYEIAVELDAHPDADLVYCDSDQIDENGLRSNPYFKTDWNYDLMLGHNMISHLGAYRRTLVERLGGLREGYEGSQDYDLALRVADETEPDRIRHIPAILYHWRRDWRDASFSDRAHERCVAAAHAAISDHLRRRGVRARVQPSAKVPHFTRIVYELPEPPPLVTIAILARPGLDGLAARSADILLGAAYPALEMLVVLPADAAEDGGLQRFAEHPRVSLVHVAVGEAAKNRAVREARGDVVVLLADGLAAADPHWVEELVARALRPDVGAVGPVVIGIDGTMQEAGVVSNAPDATIAATTGYVGNFGIFALARNVSAVSSSCVAIRRERYLAAGGIDDEVSSRDADLEFCAKLRAQGYRIVVTPYAEMIASNTPVRTATHGGEAGAREDPFYSPNLSLQRLFKPLAEQSRRVAPWSQIARRLAVRADQARRSQQLLAGLTRAARVLEIGPSYSPIAARADGWNTTIVDHASRATLVEKYANSPDVWVERVEEVDFVWTGGSIADALPPELHGTFDAFVASHVIEHVPDVIAFLAAAETLLTRDGSIVLAVPDKRYCFDYFRPVSTTADVLDAKGSSRHSPRAVFAHWAYMAENGAVGAWGQEPVTELRLMNRFDDVALWMRALDRSAGADYVDVHAWQFTPSSFELVLLELARLGETDWRIVTITPAIGCEFHVTLRRRGAASASAMTASEFDAHRVALLRSALAEIGEQVRYAT